MPSKGRNKTRYAILGMLSVRPKSGYDIKKDIESGFASLWNESFGQIYKTLRSLEDGGLVTRKKYRQGGRPDKSVFTITVKGMKELRSYLMDPADKLVVRDESMLKFALGFNVEPEYTVRLLEREITKIKDTLEMMKAKHSEMIKELDSSDSKRIHLELLFEMGEAFFIDKIRWCRRAAGVFRKRTHDGKQL